MISASRLAHSFQNLARYLETPKAHREDLVRVAWMEGRNVLSDENLSIAAREMDIVASSNIRAKRPVLHMSISWAPEDDPSRNQMTEVAERVLKKLNLQDHQTMLVAHGDEHYAHLHTMVNRIHPVTRRPQSLGLYYRDVQEILRKAEREMGFRETPGHYYQLPDQSPPDRRESLSKRAHKATQSRGEIPFQVLVRETAEADFDVASSWEDLHARLHKHGLQLIPSGSGLVVTDQHEYAKCSSVAKNASLRKLEARFGESWRVADEISMTTQIQKLQKIKVAELSPDAKRSVVKQFTQLDIKGIDLKAKLGQAIYNSLKTLSHDEKQRSELGL
ncbi:MAG: relaxase/mobilization nuclease domain-containing protein [Bacteroidetes bacterium]|nr:relaxase/mobilization nuclease domain-containing protein [Bacteroidota bacterium]